MTVEWNEASESVITITDQMVAKYHPEIRNLRIGLLFRNEAQLSKGSLVLAQVSKVSAKDQALIDFDVLIWVAQDYWNGKLNDHQRQALIDHELCHIRRKSDGEIELINHDIQEFTTILNRWGLWNRDLVAFAGSITPGVWQGELFSIENVKEALGKIEGVSKVTLSHLNAEGEENNLVLVDKEAEHAG